MIDHGREDIEMKFWSTIFDLLNASYKIVSEMQFAHNKYAMRRINENLICGTFVARALTSVFDSFGFNFLYPLKMDNHVVAVPEALPYDGFNAYLRSLATFSLLGYSILLR